MKWIEHLQTPPEEYHKIRTVFLRESEGKHPMIIPDADHFATPEFDYLQDADWDFTEKIHGMNSRVEFLRDRDGTGHLLLGGRNDNSQIPADVINYLNRRLFPRDRWDEKFSEATSVRIYGEAVAAGIQKGCERYLAPGEDAGFVVFDVQIDGWWLSHDNIVDIADWFGVSVTPIYGHGTLWDMTDFVKEGLQSDFGDFQAEGLVARPSVPLFARNGERIIAKLKTRDFPRE